MPRRQRARDDREAPLMPPRKRDWKEGHNQVGVFFRTKMGGKIEFVCNDAPQELYDELHDAVLRHLNRLSEKRRSSAEGESTMSTSRKE